MNVSPDLIWAAVRKNNSYRTQSGLVILSSEPGNLRGFNTPRDSGLANAKAIDIEIGEDGGLIVSKKNNGNKNRNRPRKGFTTTRYNPKKTYGKHNCRKIKKQCKGYRSDQTRNALNRYSRLYETSRVAKKTAQTTAAKKAKAT
eukprot:TRINITY_DN926_c0_g1_i2.p1 TRINITY_DN926_c0_g1~~TRINITY_DN926_c0_g1_i2.p1  ORF type:complete len:144 (+),score=23.85 TRINITY_DN926_c0_g1_i2:95-526(+)